MANAMSSNLPSESPSSTHAPDSAQQVVGSRPKMSDERHTALKRAFLENVQRVMGSSHMTADDVLAALRLAGLLPDYVDPIKYVTFALRTNADLIQRVYDRSGFYRLREGNPYGAAEDTTASSQA